MNKRKTRKKSKKNLQKNKEDDRKREKARVSLNKKIWAYIYICVFLLHSYVI